MKYTVTWVPSAEDELARLYLTGPDPAAVTEAANQIDKELGNDAHDKGRDCDGDRVFRQGPLLIFFAVSPDDRLVEVLQVELIG